MDKWRIDVNNDWSKASVYVQYTCARHNCKFAVRGEVEGASGEYPCCCLLSPVELIRMFEEGGCSRAEVGQVAGKMTRLGFVPNEGKS